MTSSEGVAVLKRKEITQVPVKASGWRILVEPVAVQEKTDGGIVLSEMNKEAQKYLRHFGQVIDVGPLVYQDPKFKDRLGFVKPFCELGDWVAYGRHAGQDIYIKQFDADGKDIGVLPLKLLNDDDILAVIDDPKLIETTL